MADNLASLIHLINSRFDDVKSRFDDVNRQLSVIVDGNEQRDIAMNAKHLENSKRLDALESDVGFVKTLCKNIGKALAVVATAIGIWKAVH